MRRNFSGILKIGFGFILTLVFEQGKGQDTLVQERVSKAKTYKSYNSYRAPLIEDNSFFVEEAFNQSSGVIQFISTCYINNIHSQNLAYSLTQEMPLKDVKHQISYTINYFSFSGQEAVSHGLGDILINYRYELKGKEDWALMAPRISLIIPSGDYRKEFGSGAWGGQFNFPLSKMVSNRVVLHYNTGVTFLKDAKFTLSDATTTDKVKHKDLKGFNIGASVIWMPLDKLNMMFEYVSTMNDMFNESGQVTNKHQVILNPGFRYAFDLGKCQIVPGISVPIAIEDKTSQPGAFFYLSIEPNYSLK